eukprot:56126-Eustigmatos_ZCMA.PRE.2
MADQFIYETAVGDNSTEHTPFVKRVWIYINDTNAGSYSGTIQFDTAAAANSGKWVNWQEAYLMIPITVVSKSSVDITGAANAYMCGLKNGSHQLINSFQVNYNGTSVVQQTPLLGHYVQYKLMTTYSTEDVIKSGASTQFYPDNASSFRWSQYGDSRDGNGISNNRLSGAVNSASLGTAGTMPDQTNVGAYQRSKQVLDFSTAGMLSQSNLGNLLSDTSGGFLSSKDSSGNWTMATPLISSANAATVGRARFTDNSGSGAARVYYWEIMAKIPLRNLCDFFAQMPPLVKGALIQFNIGYNSSSQTIACDTSGRVTLSSAVPMTGLTNPLLIASAAANQPNAATFGGSGGTTASTQTFACGIVSATDGTNSKTNGIVSVCRLYLPLYTLTGTAEESLLKLHPTRTIQYQDLYQYTVSSVSAGASFSQLLSSSIVNPKTIVILPYINKAMLPGNHASNPVYCSPFSTEGSTTSP